MYLEDMNHASKARAFPSDASPLGLKDAILIVCNPFGSDEVGIAGGTTGGGGGCGGVCTSLHGASVILFGFS